MSEPSLPELEAERDRLFAQLSDGRRLPAGVGERELAQVREAELRVRGRRIIPGHGPRFLWTRSAGRRKTVGRQLAAAEVEKVRREVARHAEFTAISEQIIEVNEKICEARPVAGTDAPSAPEGEKGGSRGARGREVRRDRPAGGGGGHGRWAAAMPGWRLRRR